MDRILSITQDYVEFSKLSYKKQKSILQDSGYRDLGIIKLKKGQGYYFTQPFEKPKVDNDPLLSKYSYYFGVVLGFDDSNTQNLSIEPLVNVKNIYSRSADFALAGGYFIENNTAFGLRLGYSLNDSRISAESSLLELVMSTKSLRMSTVSSGFSVGVFVKNFIPLDQNERIFITNETNLDYSNKHSLSRTSYDNNSVVRKTEEDRDLLGLGITPGFMYFISSGFSIEFQISPLLVFYESSEVINNESEHGNSNGGGLNFILTPLKMNFGLSYFFGLDYKRRYKGE